MALTLGITMSLLFAFLLLVNNSQKTSRAYKFQQTQLKKLVKSFQQDTVNLVKDWQLQEQHNISIRPDDPNYRKAGPQETLAVVIFSDFECPMCRATAAFFKQKVQPMFDGYVRIIYKHYPFNSECNPTTKSRMHPYACRAAAVAEAARIQGGNDAFWRAHDWLFAHQSKFAALEADTGLRALAHTLKLDPDQLIENVKSDAVAKRIAEDAEVGKQIGVDRTPMVFISGKPIHSLAVRDENFWRDIAKIYWRSIHKKPPPNVEKLLTGTTNNSESRKTNSK